MLYLADTGDAGEDLISTVRKLCGRFAEEEVNIAIAVERADELRICEQTQNTENKRELFVNYLLVGTTRSVRHAHESERVLTKWFMFHFGF